MNNKILVGVPRKDHILLAYDEIEGLNKLGYRCIPFKYVRSDQTISHLTKYIAVIADTLKLIFKLYVNRPAFLYLNSRLDSLASLRDAFVIQCVRIFYLKKLRIIIKTHGSDPYALDRNTLLYKEFVFPILSKQVDAWFFLSQEEKNLIDRKNKVLSKKIFVTANIVENKRSVRSEEFRKKYGLGHKLFDILYVSRMRKEKGAFEVLRAIPNILRKEDCLFTFVGDGPDFEELKELASELKITPFVQFVGFIPDEECNHFYANTDLLVFPTYFDEGFPMVLFKSVAAGLPVITTRTRAALDYLNEPDHVLWVQAKSPNEVSQAINRLLKDGDLRNKMAQNNRLLGAKFNPASVCQDMKTVFEKVR